VAAFAPAGHHSPEDMVLLFDVAKFKYPPHWVPLAALHDAMKAADTETGQPRGYLLLRRRGVQGELRGAPHLSLDLPQAEAALAYARGVRAWLKAREVRQGAGALEHGGSVTEDFATFAIELDPPGFRASECLKVHAPTASVSILLNKLRNETFLLKAWTAGRSPPPGQPEEGSQETAMPLDAPGKRLGGGGSLEPRCCSPRFLSDREARAVLALACPACDESWRAGAEDGPGSWDSTPELAAGRPGGPPPAPWNLGGLSWWASAGLPREVAREVDHVAAQLRAFAAGG